MLLRDLLMVLDGNLPYWINDNGDAERYSDSTIPFDSATLNRDVVYVTLDGEGELTICLDHKVHK